MGMGGSEDTRFDRLKPGLNRLVDRKQRQPPGVDQATDAPDFLPPNIFQTFHFVFLPTGQCTSLTPTSTPEEGGCRARS
jgi:hypothetical protein